MDNLPKVSLKSTKLSPSVHQMMKQVETTTVSLAEIAKKEGVDVGVIAKIWAALPLEENEGITYLEMASQCILEISAAIDQTFPDLPYFEKIAKKYELMADLLRLKAEQVRQT